MRAIARRLREAGDELHDICELETGLPRARLEGELERTCVQLELMADAAAEGSHVEAIIDTADPDAPIAPRPDLRRMLVPLGPVAVFGASNFPYAFSVAGGDTRPPWRPAVRSWSRATRRTRARRSRSPPA